MFADQERSIGILRLRLTSLRSCGFAQDDNFEIFRLGELILMAVRLIERLRVEA